MGSAEITAFFRQMQKALQILTALQLTAYMFPPHAIVNDGDSFDFIVVGAGTAGSVVANRLSRNPAVNVLLVEAGGDPPLESDLPGPIYLLKRSIHEWNYHSEPDNFFGQCHQKPYFEMTLGKMLGGSSSLNYMIYERGTPQDFNSWSEAVNDSTWKWENVVPYYEKSAKFEDPNNLTSNNEVKDYLIYVKDAGDVDNFFKAYTELGYKVEDHSDDATNTYYMFPLTLKDGKRQSSATAFLTPVKDRENLKVMKNTMVNKILFDENKNAVGVEVTTNDGKKLTFKATKEIIVSAGAMNTPKLLMLSGIGPRDHLEDMKIDVISDLPVGQNLHDQVSASVSHNMEVQNKPFPPINPHKYPPTGIAGFVSLDNTKGVRDYQTLTYVTQPRVVRAFCAFLVRYKYEVCDDFYDSGEGRRLAFNQIIKMKSKSRGKVMLRSADPNDPPSIYAGYLDDPEDSEDLARYLLHFALLMNTTYFRSINASFGIPSILKCGELASDSLDYWKCYLSCTVIGMSYFTSSCAMGPVLDSQLRVRGVQRLRVADASVMPSSVSASPYGTIVMIGEKAADFITKEHEL